MGIHEFLGGDGNDVARNVGFGDSFSFHSINFPSEWGDGGCHLSATLTYVGVFPFN